MESGDRQNQRVQLRQRGQLVQASSNVSANRDDLQIGPQIEQLRAAACAAGGDRRAIGQIRNLQAWTKAPPGNFGWLTLSRPIAFWLARQEGRATIDQNITHIGALAHSTELQTSRQLRRQILETVYRKIRLTGKQSGFKF